LAGTHGPLGKSRNIVPSVLYKCGTAYTATAKLGGKSMTEPTQADRDAATRWGTGPVYNMDHLAQAFARHRIASTAELRTALDAAYGAILALKEKQP